MPVFRLTERLLFPPPRLSADGGLLAVGGDLTPARLLLAYRQGIFPWFSEGEPILWWSPDPRFILFPDRLRISRSMKRILGKGVFAVTFDTAFADVVTACREQRRRGEGTWITPEMTSAYIRLHRMGLAHSVEAWREGRLAGGLYGVSLGKCFFGESMFSRAANASKAALVTLVGKLAVRGFRVIDCQVYTEHLRRLGADGISREDFLALLDRSLAAPTLRGSWRFLNEVPAVTPGRGDVPSAALLAGRRRLNTPYFVQNPQ
jgi:leucyl/phenylalanyl-tRNA--protein transferase